jgi:hypothetical protein
MSNAAEKSPTVEERTREIHARMEAEEESAKAQARENQARAIAEAEAAEVLRLQKLEEIRARAKKELSGKDLEAARKGLAVALESFVSVCRAYDDRHSEILEPLVTDSSLQPLPANWGNAGNMLWRLQIDGEEIPRATAQTDISKSAREAYQKHYPRQSYSLDSPRDN